MHKSRQTLLSQLLFIHPAMASTLAQQLHRIAAKSVNTVSAEKRKALYAVSLLFPASQAATQDLTTVYSIALEGFRELVDLDPAFRKFERGLFSPTSIEVDRFVQSKSDNAELDRNIDEFLGLVGQRLLLKGAIKALEWLIRKFRYNFSRFGPIAKYTHLISSHGAGFTSKIPPLSSWLFFLIMAIRCSHGCCQLYL